MGIITKNSKMKIGKLNFFVGLAAACSGIERCFETYYPTTENFVTDTNFELVMDSVMGGVSVAEIKSENGILNFSGELSLENRGGFASFQGNINDACACRNTLRIDLVQTISIVTSEQWFVRVIHCCAISSCGQRTFRSVQNGKLSK